jgi:pimeloyl-ACP methyl ester carboxylesterase
MLLLNPGIITTGVPPITSYLFFPLPRLAAKIFGQREFRENFLTRSFVNTELITAATMDAMMLGPRSDDYLTGTTALMNYYREGDEIEMLANVRVPTLIVWGNLDAGKLPDEPERLQAMIPGSRLVRVGDAGHYVHEEQPREVAAALRDNLDFWATRR